MSATADRIGAIRETTAAEIEALRQRRREISLDVIGGDVQARAELASIDLQLGELDARIVLCGLAEEERVERERQATEVAAAAERRRLEAEADRLEGELDAAVRGTQKAAVRTGQAVAEALRIDGELQCVRDNLGQSARGIAGVVGDLVFVRIRDEAGPIGLGPVMAARRAALLAECPIDKHPADDPAPTRRACSVCSHPQRQELEAALAAGETLRAVGERFSVSKSALSRHGQHAVDTTPDGGS